MSQVLKGDTNCPFYGRHAVRTQAAFPLLITQHGNQCALITEGYAPCRMEIRGGPVDWKICDVFLERFFHGVEPAIRNPDAFTGNRYGPSRETVKARE